MHRIDRIVKRRIRVGLVRAGIPKSWIHVPKKSGILSGIMHYLLQILCFVSLGRVQVSAGTGSKKSGIE